MITQFSKRSIDLFVLRILKEKWFFLIQCARRKLFSYNWTGYSIITGFANDLYALSCRKIIEETASDLLERKKAVRQWCSQCICYTLVACWSTSEAKKTVVISVYLQLVCEISTEIDCTGKEPYIVILELYRRREWGNQLLPFKLDLSLFWHHHIEFFDTLLCQKLTNAVKSSNPRWWYWKF